MQLAKNEFHFSFTLSISDSARACLLSRKQFKLMRENVISNVAYSTVNNKASLLFYCNYLNSPVFNNRENNCNTNTSKS